MIIDLIIYLLKKLKILDFETKFTINDAVKDLVEAFDKNY